MHVLAAGRDVVVHIEVREGVDSWKILERGRPKPFHQWREWGVPDPALFSIVNEIYEYYEARSAISIFQMLKFFSHYFLGFKLEIFDPRNIRNPICFSALSNGYVNNCQYDPVLCPNKLIYRQQIIS